MQTARVQWVGKERFVAQAPSGHMVALDSDRSSNGAPGPMELLLIALGACTATDVVAILRAGGATVASTGITVNSVLPGRIATDRIYELSGGREAAEEVGRTEVPLGRLGVPQEIAAPVAKPSASGSGTSV